jgi:hypothetical protein
VKFNQTREFIMLGTNYGFFRYDAKDGKRIAQREIFPESEYDGVEDKKAESTLQEDSQGVYDVQLMYSTNISVLIENRNKNTLLLWDDHNARIFAEKALDEESDILNMQLLWDYIFIVQVDRITVMSWKDLIPCLTYRTGDRPNKDGIFAVSQFPLNKTN